MISVSLRRGTFTAIAFALVASRAGAQAAPNTLTAAEKKAGWKLLFDGTTTTGWRGYQMTTLPAEWMAMDGALMKTKPSKDIVTLDTFANFELTLEWKVSSKGNSGIFYRATEEYDHVYWSAIEYQLGEDSTPDSRNIMTAPGAAYGFYPSKRGVPKPPGEWNTTRIVVNGPHIEHWLNGVQLSSFEMWSPEWNEKLHGVPGDSTKKPLKFAPYANFGLAKKGVIAIQGDHPGELGLRNIKIKVLK